METIASSPLIAVMKNPAEQLNENTLDFAHEIQCR